MIDILAVAGHFRLGDVHPRPDIPIAGSPERTEFRLVVEDFNGRLIILEQVNAGRAGHKKDVAQVLACLSAGGIQQVVPFLTDGSGETLALVQGQYWQAVPYVSGVPLDRPAYAFEGWRGAAAARFLVAMRKAAAQSPGLRRPSFDLPAYIDGLWRAIRRRRSDVEAAFMPMKRHVDAALYPLYSRLPTGFCHGDYHAVNIIWGAATIHAVIDWEFLGVKPELYDAANMLACLGIEDPAALEGDYVRDFIGTLKGSGLFAAESFRVLPDLMIGLRFAWLSEWLRKNDEDMIQMELDYFEILKERREDLAAL